jgi:hypothetical protein
MSDPWPDPITDPIGYIDRENLEIHKRPPLRICLVASSKLGVFPSTLVDFLSKRAIDTIINLRAGNKTPPGLFERMFAQAATEHFWFNVDWYRPDPALGREGTYLRDVHMVRKSDLVLAFFEGVEMTGGTGHVVEKAQDQGVPVYAYGFDGTRWHRIGEHDPDHVWSDEVPRV